jgi:hypothetical protein
LDRSIENVQATLNQLPRPPSSNPLHDVAELIHSFCRDLDYHIQGTAERDGIVQQLRPCQNEFRKTIRQSAPNFQPYEKKDEARRYHDEGPRFLLQEDTREWPEASRIVAPTKIFIDEVMQRMEE